MVQLWFKRSFNFSLTTSRILLLICYCNLIFVYPYTRNYSIIFLIHCAIVVEGSLATYSNFLQLFSMNLLP